MESWSFNSVRKDFVADESISTADAIATSKFDSSGWGVKSPFIHGNSMVVSPNQVSIDNQGFVELGFPQMMRNSLFDPVMATTQNAFAEEEESSSKLSRSIVQSNCRRSTLFDLKLGGVVDRRDTQVFNSSKNIAPKFKSAEVAITSKRPRAGGFGSPTPFCQVHGCNKDLSSSKDYHKRHKVCEAHSKTAKVIVNGIEQRFCQQCSRFHLLGEFDDGKRSCRKRLAGHNKRRRKPHVGVHYGRTGRYFPSYNSAREAAGSKFKESTVLTSSIPGQDILPNTLPSPYQQKYEANEWWHIKLEDGTANDLQSMSCVTDGRMHSKAIFPCNFEKDYPPLHGNNIGSIFDGSSNSYSQEIGTSDSLSRPLFHNSPIRGGKGDFVVVGSAKTVQGLPGMASNSRSALSLLSSQSQSTSCHSSRIPMSYSNHLLIPNGQNAHYELSQVSGVSSNLNPILISEGNDVAKYGNYGVLLGSRYVNSEDQVFSDDGCTIDLLQLSSQLHRVEHQQQRLHAKHGNDVSVGLSIT